MTLGTKSKIIIVRKPLLVHAVIL